MMILPLTAATTRREYLEYCARSYAEGAKHGGNTAILNHVVKLHNMTDAHWEQHHRPYLLERDPARAAAIRRMAEEVMRKAG